MLQLCCLLRNHIIVDNNDKVNKQEESIQTTIKVDDYVKRNISEKDTIIELIPLETIKYWFNEILLYLIHDYKDNNINKNGCKQSIFDSMDLNNIIQCYKKYNNIYNYINSENIRKFVINEDNYDFIQDIKINANIYFIK